MGKAARAIIIEDGNILVMHRDKQGSQYFTLVGGRIADGETIEQGLIREVKEETGLNVTKSQLVFVEEHPEPYNQQHIYLCEVGPHEEVKIQEYSEEARLNRMDVNLHKPVWSSLKGFDRLAFRTPQLQEAILRALKKGFPKTPIKL